MYEKSKIAFLADSYLHDESTGVNGTQVQMHNLAHAFASRGLDVHYISLTKLDKPLIKNQDHLNFYWIKDHRKPGEWLLKILKFNRFLDQIQPDIVYQRGRSFLTFIAAHWAKKNQKRFVWATNGEDSCEFWKYIKLLKRSQRGFFKNAVLFPIFLLQDLLVHQGIRGAHFVVNQTDFQKQRLMENFSKEGQVIPSYFPISKSNDQKTKEKRVLWLANLNLHKQPEIFISLADYCQELDYQFILAGGTKNSDYENNLKKQAKNLNNIQFTGTVPFRNTDEFYSRAFVFVNTSRQDADGLPNAFIQAMLNGTPIISLNHDPNGWLEKYDLGICCYGDIEIFLKKSKELLNHPDQIKKMGNNAIQFAQKTFANEEIIDQYCELFRSISLGP